MGDNPTPNTCFGHPSSLSPRGLSIPNLILPSYSRHRDMHSGDSKFWPSGICIWSQAEGHQYVNLAVNQGQEFSPHKHKIRDSERELSPVRHPCVNQTILRISAFHIPTPANPLIPSGYTHKKSRPSDLRKTNSFFPKKNLATLTRPCRQATEFVI